MNGKELIEWLENFVKTTIFKDLTAQQYGEVIIKALKAKEKDNE